jgi:hypothetical protein
LEEKAAAPVHKAEKYKQLKKKSAATALNTVLASAHTQKVY